MEMVCAAVGGVCRSDGDFFQAGRAERASGSRYGAACQRDSGHDVGHSLCGNGMRHIKEIDGRSLLFLFLSALATGASWLFYFRALQCGDASKVAPIDKLSVAITIFLSIVLLGEPAELKTILGGLLITCGSLVLLL